MHTWWKYMTNFCNKISLLHKGFASTTSIVLNSEYSFAKIFDIVKYISDRNYHSLISNNYLAQVIFLDTAFFKYVHA